MNTRNMAATHKLVAHALYDMDPEHPGEYVFTIYIPVEKWDEPRIQEMIDALVKAVDS